MTPCRVSCCHWLGAPAYRAS